MTQGKDTSSSNPVLAASGVRLARLSVLVAAADPALVRQVTALLDELGVTDATCVDSAPGALEALTRRVFDVLLCAEQVGGDAGLFVLERARQASPATRAVIVAPPGAAANASGAGRGQVAPLQLTRATLGAFLADVAAPAGGSWCTLPHLTLADILQLYHQGGRSIVVLISGPIAGRVVLFEGAIVDAEAEQLRGLGALSRLLEAEVGLIRTEVPTLDPWRSIDGAFQHVILEATRRLDERRRDSLVDGLGYVEAMGRGAGDPGPSAIGRELRSAAPQPTEPPHALIDPAVFGPDPSSPALGAVPTSPESSLAFGDAPLGEPAPFPPNPWYEPVALHPETPRRRRWPLIATSALGLVALVAVASAYIGSRSQQPSANHTRTLSLQAAKGPTGSPARPLDAPGPSDSPPPHAPPPPSGASSAASLAGPVSDAAAPAEPSSFVLTLYSKPTRARVLEGGKVLGRTPLRVPIERASVATSPRKFVVKLPGYRPYTVTQGDSASDVRFAARLTSRPELEPPAPFATSSEPVPLRSSEASEASEGKTAKPAAPSVPKRKRPSLTPSRTER